MKQSPDDTLPTDAAAGASDFNMQILEHTSAIRCLIQCLNHVMLDVRQDVTTCNAD